MSSQESSPITQWREKIDQTLGYHFGPMLGFNVPPAKKAITSATIELIEGLIPKEKIDRFFGLSLYEGDDTGLDTPHLTEREEGYNQALAELRQSLKELRQ